MWRAIMALMIGYSAFIAEVFRAGIQSVDKGQVEAAKARRALRYQRFRLVVFPQADPRHPARRSATTFVRWSRILPRLGARRRRHSPRWARLSSGSFRFFENLFHRRLCLSRADDRTVAGPSGGRAAVEAVASPVGRRGTAPPTLPSQVRPLSPRFPRAAFPVRAIPLPCA